MARWDYPDGLLSSRFPGGESGWDVSERVVEFTDDLSRNSAGKCRLVLSHGIVISIMNALLTRRNLAELDSSRASPPHGWVALVDDSTSETSMIFPPTYGRDVRWQWARP
jgi:broad specificity phosphatase PhoE